MNLYNIKIDREQYTFTNNAWDDLNSDSMLFMKVTEEGQNINYEFGAIPDLQYLRELKLKYEKYTNLPWKLRDTKKIEITKLNTGVNLYDTRIILKNYNFPNRLIYNVKNKELRGSFHFIIDRSKMNQIEIELQINVLKSYKIPDTIISLYNNILKYGFHPKYYQNRLANINDIINKKARNLDTLKLIEYVQKINMTFYGTNSNYISIQKIKYEFPFIDSYIFHLIKSFTIKKFSFLIDKHPHIIDKYSNYKKSNNPPHKFDNENTLTLYTSNISKENENTLINIPCRTETKNAMIEYLLINFDYKAYSYFDYVTTRKINA